MLGFLHRVGEEEDGGALGREAVEVGPDLPARRRIKARGEFVEDRDSGPSDQGQGHGESLLLPAGELFEALAALVGEPEALEQFSGRPRLGIERPEQVEGLARGDLGREPALLQLHPDEMPEPGVLAGQVDAGDGDGAGIGRTQTADRLHQRGLARTVGAEDADDLALGDIEVDAAQDLARAIGLVDVSDLDQCHDPSVARIGGRNLRRLVRPQVHRSVDPPRGSETVGGVGKDHARLTESGS